MLIAASASATAETPVILVFGDSISAGYGLARVEQGWVALLQTRLKEQEYGYQVVNASVSGETTAGAKILLLGMRMPPNYGPDYTEQFRMCYMEVARDEKLPLVPFLLNDVALSPNLMQADGVHPNELGQPKLLANVWPSLKPLLHH